MYVSGQHLLYIFGQVVHHHVDGEISTFCIIYHLIPQQIHISGAMKQSTRTKKGILWYIYITLYIYIIILYDYNICFDLNVFDPFLFHGRFVLSTSVCMAAGCNQLASK